MAYDFFDLLLQGDDLVLKAFIELLLVLDRAGLDFHGLENLARLSSPEMGLAKSDSPNYLSISNPSQHAANMRLNDDGFLVEREKLTILARQIASTQCLFNH